MAKRKTQQLAFEGVVEASFRSHERRMLRYMVDNREKYIGFGRYITPALSDPEQVYSRIAFAILSANAPFDWSVRALNYAIEHKGRMEAKDLAPYGMVPAKADYCNKVWNEQEELQLTKLEGEGWSEYRYRLQSLIMGLGIAKASFAVSLLYPVEADVACIDTWMQKVFLGNTGFKQLNRASYEAVEARVRSYAKRVGCGAFIAQWMIWDHARGGRANEHAIFPGSHKD